MSINIHSLTKTFQSGEDTITALDNISLQVDKNSFLAIIGSSGSGKSTLLSLIAGLEKPTHGSILIEGKSLVNMNDKELSAFRNKNIGFIFQQFMLLKDFTVQENIMLPYYIFSGNKKQSQLKALALLEKMGLEHKKNQYPSEISGGEAQRVAIARALINSPSIILADEPTGSLDAKNQEMVLSILLERKKESPFTLLLVTHNLSFAHRADQVMTLEFGKWKEPA